MTRAETPGRLIVFEGLDQSGKATQSARLYEALAAAGHRVVRYAFPDYTTPLGRELEAMLRGATSYPPDAAQLLYVANRHEHRERMIAELEAGVIIVSDRYLASTCAYGEAQGLDPGWLGAIQIRLPVPDLTVLLDVDPDTARSRKASGRDTYERDVDLLTRVARVYRRLAEAPGWVRIDGTAPPDRVTADVASEVTSRLGLP